MLLSLLHLFNIRVIQTVAALLALVLVCFNDEFQGGEERETGRREKCDGHNKIVRGEENQRKDRKAKQKKAKELAHLCIGLALKATVPGNPTSKHQQPHTHIHYAKAHIHFACILYLHFKHPYICI